MAEGWEHDRARGFKEQQCRAYQQELKLANLFSSNKEILTRSFVAEALESVHHLINEDLLLETRDNVVLVIHRNYVLCELSGADAEYVADLIAKEPYCNGMALAKIVDASAIGGEFHLRLLDHTKEGS